MLLEQPPRSAKVVASVDMGSGPGGGDYRTDLLSTDRKRSGWTLWAGGDDSAGGRKLYCTIAWGKPFRGYSARYAAEHLLAKSWEDEVALGCLGTRVVVTAPGLLTEEDVRRVAQRVFKQ